MGMTRLIHHRFYVHKLNVPGKNKTFEDVIMGFDWHLTVLEIFMDQTTNALSEKVISNENNHYLQPY